MFAHGFQGYIQRDPLGAAVVFSSILEIILSDLDVNMVGFRALRLLRPLLAIKFFEGIKAILRGLSQNSNSMLEVGPFRVRGQGQT